MDVINSFSRSRVLEMLSKLHCLYIQWWRINGDHTSNDICSYRMNIVLCIEAETSNGIDSIVR